MSAPVMTAPVTDAPALSVADLAAMSDEAFAALFPAWNAVRRQIENEISRGGDAQHK